ncbi:MAG TPA: lysophospholipid acyltransferase family protein, partial [Bryobacteraceae bacterium]|nr:lysophospholipid acyltransferase family protein [Bryobacteraceae bacterium]
MPRSLAFAAARAIMRSVDIAMPRFRRIAAANLALAMPEANSQAVIEGMYVALSRMLVVFSRFPDFHRGNIGEWIRYEGFEHFEEAVRRGKGALFATAHLGAWELSAFAHALMAKPMHIVIRPLDNGYVDEIVSRRRSASGNRLIPKKDAALSIFRALKANGAVGILVDQNVALEEGVFVDFFGVKACAGSAFARLAHRSGAAVIPGFALWSEKEKKYVLRFYPLLEFSGDTQADTQLLHSCIENVIRQYPEQWLWIHRRWKT